jgi:hypothetical protein
LMSANLTDFPSGRKKRWRSSGCPDAFEIVLFSCSGQK